MPRNRLEPILLTAGGPIGHGQTPDAQAVVPRGRKLASRTDGPSTESLLKTRPMSRCVLSILVLAALPPSLYSQGFPPITIQSVVNAASFQPGMPSGGTLATVFCSNLIFGPFGFIPEGTFTAPPSAPLPFELKGIGVMVNGALAPVLALANSGAQAQINFQVPMERNATGIVYPDTGTLTIVQIFCPDTCLVGSASAPYTLAPPGLAGAAGGFFSDAKGYAVAQHASDFTPVTVQNPAHAGEALIAYADDFFAVWPPPPIAIPAPAQPLFTYAPILIQRYVTGGLYLQEYPKPTIKGFLVASTPPLQVTFAGLAPGQIGTEQINFVVPADQAPGDWALFYSNANQVHGGNTSPSVLLPVR